MFDTETMSKMGFYLLRVSSTQIILHSIALVVVLIILPSTNDVASSGTPSFPRNECPGSNVSYVIGSKFEADLNHTLLDILPANVLINGSSSFIAGEGTDQVYALCYCRGDVSAQDCHDCVLNTAESLLQKCRPLKEGIAWNEKCTLRYSNRDIISLEEEVPTYHFYNFSGDLNVLDQYRKVFDDTMGGLIDKAAFGAAVGNLPGYATAEAELPQSQFKLQGLVQCSPDIVGSPCEKCLKSALKQMDGWATTMIFLPSCNLRFGLYSSQFNAPPPTPSPPPPPPPPGWLIPVAVVTSLSLLAGVVFLIQRYTGFINCTPRKQDGVRTEHSAASTSAEPVSPSFTDSSDDTVVPLDMPEFEALLHKIEVIREATEDFSENNWIGGGGFGDVYRGVLPNGQAIAVKRLSSISDQGEREFNNEVVLLANLRHRNLVKLLGFCIAGSEKYLVYEFVPNNSLAEFIYHSERRPQLNWPMRVKIIKGIARGMLYLHRDSPDRIIHRDLKPANVLLDVHMVPKIADFGLARITNFQQTHIETSNVAGTRGYIAPEYFLYGHFSVRSDVYSFGVIMLEMVSGRRVGAVVNQDGVIQVPGLVSYAWSCWARGELLPLIDATLGNEYSEYEVYRRIQIGLLCVQEDTYMRPDMETVVRWLNTAEDLPTPEHHGFHALQILHEEVFHDLEDA